MSSWTLWLCAVLLICPGLAADVPFVFNKSASDVAGYTPAQLEQAYAASPDLIGVPSVSTPSDSEILEFPITGGGSSPVGTTDKNVGELKKAFNARVEPENPRIHEEALVLVARFPGDLTIDQICSIYSYLKNGESPIKGWSYARDPRGIDYFMYANESLRVGERSSCVGVGDCDDFAILMSALIESIGGTTRIILAHNNSTGGHAYAEVYLGQLKAQNSLIEEIFKWLEQKFDTDKIYTHIDTDTKDVWLNLDWGTDEKGIAHPGGPFYSGDKHIVLAIRDRYGKTPLNPLEKTDHKDASEKPLNNIGLNAGVKALERARTPEPTKNELSDPAVAFCVKRGNIYENGKCTFPGGSSCDVWEFYTGDCILTGKRQG